LVTTTDFVGFTDHGVVLPHGGASDPDTRIFTGSFVHADGVHHFFYTGHNPALQKQGLASQVIMHAVSADLLSWTKVPADILVARTDIYEPNDWRDPFVFWNQDAGAYWMLVTARLNEGPSRRRGCIALCTSSDLTTWSVQPPFWAPGLFHALECPDLFQMNGLWYLVFSEFTDAYRTRYRVSESIGGPWLRPENDVFDARAFYAAKTAADDKNRYLFGWSPDRVGGRDSAGWTWGGHLVVHQLKPTGDSRRRLFTPPDGAVYEDMRSGHSTRQPSSACCGRHVRMCRSRADARLLQDPG
jgi:beta-fructofuranosidase